VSSQLTFFGSESFKRDSDSVLSLSGELSAWELDDLSNRIISRVVFPGGYDATLDYLVPPELEDKIESGMRVMAPLGRGNRLTEGYCIDVQLFGDLPQLHDKKLKSIQSIIDDRRLLDDKMIQLTYWIANEYLCPIGQVLEAMLPAGVRSNAGARLTTVLYVADNADKLINSLRQRSLVQKNQSSRISVQKLPVSKSAAAKNIQIDKNNNNINNNNSSNNNNNNNQSEPVLTIKQLHVLNILRDSNQLLTSLELQFAAKCSSAPILALKRLGLIRAKTIRRDKIEPASEPAAQLTIAPYQLNPDQINALAQIKKTIEQRRHKIFLLHGVTGSGKTEVYIQAIHEVVLHCRQAIVLVPEISLTPQTVGRFKSRFSNVAVLHSHLTDIERRRQWSEIANGKIQVVVGTRSAIFAPLPKLGLIIIDEEHESSFKQGTAPRYHARDVAAKRAELENIPLILGSATPSMESWHATTITNLSAQIKIDPAAITESNSNSNSESESKSNSNSINRSIIVTNNIATNNQMCELISMPSRVKGLELPRVEIVDLREEVRAKLTYGAIHRQLHEAIAATLRDKGQVILLLNRRGFSTHLQCPACGEVVKCQKCDVSLTHHRTEEIALCHHCDYSIPAPNCCEKCGFVGIRYQGFGTQKLELEIKSRFPNASILRMDTDTMRGHGSHENMLTQFRDGKVQILLGTQMIAKGLDFPNVTLVGVINADTALHLPDFRAAERTFHLITQVAGRAGRSERGGRVIVQTYTPDHPAIQAAANHNYAQFIKQELPIRKLLGYPPFSKMIRIVFRGENEMQTYDFAKEFTQIIKIATETNQNLQTYKQELTQKELSLQKNNENKQTQNQTANPPMNQTSIQTSIQTQNQTPNQNQNQTSINNWRKILGPAPAPFAKLRGMYRFHAHIYATDKNKLLTIIKNATNTIKTPEKIQWIIDVDPIDML
jgi:primosomal protein N' (replication factor Y)